MLLLDLLLKQILVRSIPSWGLNAMFFLKMNGPKFDQVMTFNPHKGTDLAKCALLKWCILTAKIENKV